MYNKANLIYVARNKMVEQIGAVGMLSDLFWLEFDVTWSEYGFCEQLGLLRFL